MIFEITKSVWPKPVPGTDFNGYKNKGINSSPLGYRFAGELPYQTHLNHQLGSKSCAHGAAVSCMLSQGGKCRLSGRV